MTIQARLRAIEYYLPAGRLTNSALSETYPDWTVEKIQSKTGIAERAIVDAQGCSSDLAFEAAARLFKSGICQPKDIDFLLFCTQTPDYFLPTTACLLQERLGLSKAVGALDFNLGCSGFIYGLSLAKGLIETGQAKRVLLLLADTYSRLLKPDDRSVRTIFGDAGAAVLCDGVPGGEGELIGPFVFGTDGGGGENLIVRHGAFREPVTGDSEAPRLHMNGAELFAFAAREVPPAVDELLSRASLALGDVDLFAFHQANQHMLEYLRKKIGIPADKFPYAFSDCGNTVSATIPILLKRAIDAGQLSADHKVMAVGFGVGYSWGACMLRGVGDN